MDSQDLIRILILSPHTHAINLILSALREDGVEIKAQIIYNKKELYEHFNQSSWDLILYSEGSCLPIALIQDTILKQGLELPIIVLYEESYNIDSLEALESEIKDFLPFNQVSRIVSAIKREFGSQKLKLKHRLLQLNFNALEKRHQAMMDSSNTALAYIQEGMHLYCNKSYAQIFQMSDYQSLQHSPLIDLFDKDNRGLLKNALNKKLDSELELTINHQHNGNTSDVAEFSLVFTPVNYNGQDCLQLIVKHVNGNSSYSAAIKAANSKDLLTRLYTKNFFIEKIESAIGKALKHHQHSSLFVVQVNEFLDIKSNIGLSKANQVLIDIAAFLGKSIQKKFAAARLSDFQFGLLIDDCKLVESIELANFIKSKINNYITTTSLPSLQLSSSIGIAAINENALDAEDLLAKAIINLDKTISSISDNQVDDSQLQDIAKLTRYMDLALKEQRFNLLFQPIVRLADESFHDYEVLSRMIDDDGNDMDPIDFLPLANLNGLGEELDKVIIALAFAFFSQSDNENIRLVLSLTSNTLLSKTFLPWLSDFLREHKISTDRLFFQLSETQICNNLKYCTKFSKGLKQLGLNIIVYHYGCVVEPENYLDDIQPVCVKLDKSLVRDLAYNQYRQDELKSLITNLHNKNLKVVIPQVESSSALSILWNLSADYVQGYCLERPKQTMDYAFFQKHVLTIDAQPYI